MDELKRRILAGENVGEYIHDVVTAETSILEPFTEERLKEVLLEASKGEKPDIIWRRE